MWTITFIIIAYIKFDERFKVTSVTFFIADLIKF